MRVRPATRGDIDVVAPLLCLPRPGLVDLLGTEAAGQRAARAVFRSRRAVDGHRLCAVAELGGEVLGVVAAAHSSQWRALRRPTGLALVRAAPLHVRGLVRRGRILERITAALPERSTCITCLAVLPAARGRGVGRVLVEGVVGEARERGDAQVVLDVGLDNDRAIRFYEQLGFVELERRPLDAQQRGLLDIEGHSRMALRL